MDHRVIERFLTFRFSFGLASIVSSFLFFSRASTLVCVLLSLARTLRLAFVRSCALSLAFRFVFGLPLPFPLPYFVC